jgi:ParB-like chromosome segregation protein Spo0J
VNEFAALTASIKVSGMLVPLFVLPDMTLVDGYRRLVAVEKLGHASVVVNVYAGSFPASELYEELNNNHVNGSRYSTGRLDGPEFGRLKDSILKYGVLSPIIVDRDRNIVDGYVRMMACAELGLFGSKGQKAFLETHCFCPANR